MMNKTFLAALLLILAISCSRVRSPEQPVAIPEIRLDSVIAPNMLYGFNIDSAEVFEGRIRWNQTLSTILDGFNVAREALHEIALKSRNVYDVRLLKAGKNYKVIHSMDSLKSVRQFIFEPDPKSYVVYNFQDSVYAAKVEHPVKTVEKRVAAEIQSSVYDAVLEAGAPRVLVTKLVDIFAWQVNFWRIQKGDRFKVIYEEQQVNGEAIGVGRILAVYFEHFGEDYYGVYYANEDGEVDYFDEEGNSLRKTLLKAPLVFRRISSRYTGRRYHPVLKRYKAHLGTDYAADPGTEIRTVGDGVVLEARFHKYNGNYVKIRHNSTYTTQYLHMQKIRTGIRPGVKVSQGQIIGYVGSTGLANGPHLCYRFWKNGRQVDALNVDLPPLEPIDPSKLDDFLHHKNIMLHKLSLIEFSHPKILLAKVGE